MKRLDEFARRIALTLARCDGGKSYPWKQAADDMERVLAEMNTYHPRSPGKRLILRQLRNEAKSWVNVWRDRA